MNVNIIGGGIVGTSIGYHLQRNGIQVSIYDRQDAGQATEASAGIICPWVSQRRNKKWYRLVTEGAKYYPSFINSLKQETNIDPSYRRKGALCLFRDDNVLPKAYKRISKKRDTAPEMGEVSIVSRDEIYQYNTALTNHFPAVFVEGGGQVNGHKLKLAMKDAFISLGGNWINASYDDQEADITIYTTGAWGVEQNYQPKVRHQRSVVYHFRVDSDKKLVDTPVIMALGPIYMVEMGENEFAIGTTHHDTDSFELIKSEEDYKYLKSLAETYFPNDKIIDIDLKVGFKPYVRDHLPFIGKVREETYVVNGLGATGLTASPVIGREVANLLCGKETTLDLDDYSYIDETNN